MNRLTKIHLHRYLILLTLCIPNASLFASESVKFLTFGDMPYTTDKNKYGRARYFEGPLVRYVFPKLVDAEKEDHQFLVHYGDLKAGSEPCSDEIISTNIQLVSAVYPGRTIIIPGDNDWTDCDRKGSSELERLAFLQKKLLDVKLDKSFQTDFSHTRQKDNPLNQRWHKNNVSFATLHLPGTNNGRDEIKVDKKKKALALAHQRDQWNEAWIKQSIAHAKKNKHKAITFFLHADMFVPLNKKKKHADVPCTVENPEKCDGFAATRTLFRQLAVNNRDLAILIIHGDTKEFCLDRPFKEQDGTPIENLWRLNGPGDYRQMDIAEVTVKPSNKEQPFRANGILVEKPVPSTCGAPID